MSQYKLLGVLLLILFVEVASAQLPSHIPYRRGKLWGFSDSTKKILIKPVYKNISIIYPNTFIAEKRDTLFVLNKNAEPLFKVKKTPYSSRLGKSTRNKFFYIGNLYNDSLVYGIINDSTFGVFNTLTAKSVLTTQIAANYELSKFEQEEDFFVINWFIKGQRRISGVQEGRKSKTIVQVCDIERKKLIVEKTGIWVTITEDFFYRPNKKSVLLWADSLYCYFDDTLITSTKYSSIKSLGHGLFYVQKYGSQRTSSNRYGGIGQIVTQKDSVLNFDINSILLAIHKGQVIREGNFIIISSIENPRKIAVFETDSNYSFLNPFLSIKPWSDNPKYSLIKIDRPWGRGRYSALVDTLTKDTLIINNAINTKYLIGNFYLVLTISSKENENYSGGKRAYINTYHYSVVNTTDRSIKHLFDNEHEIDVAIYKDSLGNLYIYDGDKLYGIDSIAEEVTEGKTIAEWLGKKEIKEIKGAVLKPSKSDSISFAINTYKDSLTKLYHFTYLREKYFAYIEPINIEQLSKELILVYSFNDTDFYIGYSVEAPFYHDRIDNRRGGDFSYDIIYYRNDTFHQLRISNWLDKNSTEDSILYLKKDDFAATSLFVFPETKWLDERFPQGVRIKQGFKQGLISSTGKIIIKPKYYDLSYYENRYGKIPLPDNLIETNFLLGQLSWNDNYDIYRKSDCKLLIKNVVVFTGKHFFNPTNLLKVSKKGKEFYIDIYGTEYKDKGLKAVFSTLFQAILH